MLRSIFFATGLFVLLCGAACLMVDRVVLNIDEKPVREPGFRGFFSSGSSERKKVIDPPDWAAFSLMSIGSVTMLYAVALPKKNG